MLMCLCDRLAKESVMLVSFVRLTQTRVSWEEGTSVEELLPSDWPVHMSAGHFF